MRVKLLSSLAVLVLLAATSAPVWGQLPPPRTPPRPPAFSPYLNLQRRGTSPALNYYGLVKPQVEFRNSIQGLQQNYADVAAQVDSNTRTLTEPPPTGHSTSFMNVTRYYPSFSGGGKGRSAVGQPRSR